MITRRRDTFFNDLSNTRRFPKASSIPPIHKSFSKFIFFFFFLRVLNFNNETMYDAFEGILIFVLEKEWTRFRFQI